MCICKVLEPRESIMYLDARQPSSRKNTKSDGNSRSNPRSTGKNRPGAHCVSDVDSVCAYKRPYNLTEQRAPPPPKDLEVHRDRVDHKLPVWNSNRSGAKNIPLEKLPRINALPDTKFDCLYTGRSVADVGKRFSVGQYVQDAVSTKRKQDNMSPRETKKCKKYLVKLLKGINFEEAEYAWYDKVGGSPALEDAKELFDHLSFSKDYISADMLHEHILLFTPVGVAPYESRDFLDESCNGKRVLDFEDFLYYGNRICDRILVYEVFAPLSDMEKLMAIGMRVLLRDTPLTISKMRQILVRASEEQVCGRIEQGVCPMRLYELLYLEEVKKKMTRKKQTHRRITTGDATPSPSRRGKGSEGEESERSSSVATPLYCRTKRKRRVRGDKPL